MRLATSCSSSARSTAGVEAHGRAASRAPAIAASSWSGEAVPSDAAVSSVAGFSTASAGPSPATCSPRISSLVSMGAETTCASARSGLEALLDRVRQREDVAGLALVDGQLVAVGDALDVGQVARVSLLAVEHVAAAHRARLGDDLGRVGQLRHLEVGPLPLEAAPDVVGVLHASREVAEAEAVRDELEDRLVRVLAVVDLET